MANLKLSQEQLSEKYGIGIGIVSACLRGLPYEKAITPMSHRPVRFYDEKDALRAFKAYYEMRHDDKLVEATRYAEKAKKIAMTLAKM